MIKKVLVFLLVIFILSIGISPLQYIFGQESWTWHMNYNDLQNFISKLKERRLDGYKPTDIEIHPIKKQISAIFEKSNDRWATWFLASADYFTKKANEYYKEGLYLTDVEITPSSNGLLY